MALCVVDVDAGGRADVEDETVSKVRFEEDLVGKRPLDDRNTSGVVEGHGDVDEGRVTPADGGLLDEEWGGYIWRTFSITREGRSDETTRSGCRG